MDLKFPLLALKINKGKELSIEIEVFRGTRKQMSEQSPSTDVSHLTPGKGKLMDKVRVTVTILITYNPLRGVACVGETEAWSYEKNKTITRIDIQTGL